MSQSSASSLMLVVGNKNYSSWSMRPWIAMKAAGIPFSETVISLYVEGSKDKILSHSPAGKVPVLIHGDVTVWDSLAIIEYVAETFPDAKLWPADRVARARARSVSCEMHSGFASLRQQRTMNMHRKPGALPASPELLADVARIDASWSDCRRRFGQGGPFLFGAFSAADAMYAPVVSRFHVYGIDVSPVARDYMAAMMALPAWKEWEKAALAETWTLPQFEIG